ncbi:MAG: glycine oxidase maturase GoxB [Actinomycetota bacterium]
MSQAPYDGGAHEVAVVGGGIAGAAACLQLGQAGIQALWLVPPSTDGRERFGESLAPAARPILSKLGLGDLLCSEKHRSSNSLFSSWGSEVLVERHASVSLEGPGLVVDRDAFEQDLEAAALETGSIRAIPTALRDLRMEGDSWCLELADGTTRTARVAIDATGRSAVVGRRLARRIHHDHLVAAVAIVTQRPTTVVPTPTTLIEAMPDGWLYAALLPDRRLSLAYFSDPDLLPRGLSRDVTTWQHLLAGSIHVSRWIEDADFEIERPPRLTPAGVASLDRCASEQISGGWLAVGDAAASFDPLSSHGMTTALWTGVRGAKATQAWLSGDHTEVQEYAQEVSRGVDRFLTDRIAVYSRESRFAKRPFWQRRAQRAAHH